MAELEARIEENLCAAKQRNPQACTLADCKIIVKILMFATINYEFRPGSDEQRILDAHPSLRKGLENLHELFHLHVEGYNGESLCELLQRRELSIYIGETRRPLVQECFRWILQAGSYLNQHYLPNVTWCEGRLFTRDDVTTQLNFVPIELISVTSRNESRAIEGMLHETIMRTLTGANHCHRTWLWKWMSMGAYDHKNDHRYHCFTLFLTAAPSLHRHFHDGLIEFHNNHVTPAQDANGAFSSIQ